MFDLNIKKINANFVQELFSRADAGEAFVFMPSSRYGGVSFENLNFAHVLEVHCCL